MGLLFLAALRSVPRECLCAAPLNSLPKWDYKGIFVQNKHSEKYKKCSAWLFPPLNPGGHLQEPLWMLSETRQAVVHSLESAGAELFNLNPELREPGVAPIRLWGFFQVAGNNLG